MALEPHVKPTVADKKFAPAVERWRGLVSRYFPADQVDNALIVMSCESGGIPGRHNFNPSTGDDSWGLFQINRFGLLASVRPASSWLAIPDNNISFAYHLWKAEGWYKPWGCAKRLGIH